MCCTRSASAVRLRKGCFGSRNHGRQERFYDFNVWSQGKRVEKLHYMHENPVKRRLVLEPGQWAWSSFRGYAFDEPGPVRLNLWPRRN